MRKFFLVALGNPLDWRLTGERFGCEAVDEQDACWQFLRTRPRSMQRLVIAKEVDESTARLFMPARPLTLPLSQLPTTKKQGRVNDDSSVLQRNLLM